MNGSRPLKRNSQQLLDTASMIWSNSYFVFSRQYNTSDLFINSNCWVEEIILEQRSRVRKGEASFVLSVQVYIFVFVRQLLQATSGYSNVVYSL